MKYFFILTTMLIIHFSLKRSDRKVIDSATFSKHALFVSSQAVKHIRLDPNNMKEYAENFFECSGKPLDTAMFSQIISNSRALNTDVWQDGELKNLLVVQNREQEISKRYLMEKLNLAGKKQIRYFTRQINRYNETDPSDRNIYYFSKPVYNNSGEYAVVQWDNGHSGLSGGGGVNLYHLEGNDWFEVGVISSWKY
jgi:hypothetical protein